MIKRVVVTTGLKARGYVDGRYVGEEKKEVREDILGGRKRGGKAGAGGKGKKRGAVPDNIGNTVGGKRRRGKNAQGAQAGQLANGAPPRGKKPRNQTRKNASGKKTPFRKTAAPQHVPSPSQVTDVRRIGEEAKSGQFAEALAASANVKRERLHKVMAQSGLGSRRDMEIMISSGRVMVNGIVATTGTQVAPGDNVLVDQRPVKLKFSEELPRVLLYHKPEGEIVTTSDPGNRVTVFDNLPPVDVGKWINIGRLDINTSGLLIFTTSGELANRFMHPRYEVEREYAVRILGELTEEQTQRLLEGVNIDAEPEEEEEDEDPDGEPAKPSLLARFDSIEKKGGEGANHWYQVVIKEGRNREVRKMFETQGLTVSRLIRTRFGRIELPPRLLRGKMMELSPDQVRGILAGAGMKDEAEAPEGAPARPSKKRGKGKPQGGPRFEKPQGARPDKPQGGPRPAPAEGAASGEDAPAPVPGKSKRNRRGKNRRGGQGPAAGNAASAGNVAATPHDEAAGNRAESAGPPAEGGPAGPGAARRGRQRRNFRNRNNRRKGGGGEGGDGGGSAGGPPDNIGNLL